MRINGKATIFGDNINTDEIISGKYLRTGNKKIWSEKVFEILGEHVTSKIHQRKIILAGNNFGCGSSREQAVIALKEAGIEIIVAKSYAMIFYRNCINNGVIPVICSNLDIKNIEDDVDIDICVSSSTVIVGEDCYNCQTIAPFIVKIARSSGLLNYYKKFGEINF